MAYLDYERLESIDPKAFRAETPYPWINPEGLLTDDGYRRLRETLPDVSMFTPVFGKKRQHGQKSHDRYALEYSPDLDIALPWKEFIQELKGERYRRFIGRLYDAPKFDLNFHWHYTPNGCSVSPHCDAKRKLGSHIFYFNTEEDWNPAWGGETLILDDGGRLPRESAPNFEDFDRVIPSRALGNYSLLFGRNERSWHGVREIRCPEGHMRKVFIVVINLPSWRTTLRRMAGLLPKGY